MWWQKHCSSLHWVKTVAHRVSSAFFLFVFFHFASSVLCLAEKVDEHIKAVILMNGPFVSFHLPTRLLRFFFLFFSILFPLFFVWQRRWTNTLKLRFWWVHGHFLCCFDVDVLRLPSPSSVFSIIPICCGFSCLKFSCMLLVS